MASISMAAATVCLCAGPHACRVLAGKWKRAEGRVSKVPERIAALSKERDDAIALAEALQEELAWRECGVGVS